MKMDRQGVRTPAELERKYNFEKRFDEALNAVNDLDKRLTQDEVFNRLTNNGKSQGVYIGQDGNLYINASYLVTGILKSQDNETFYLDLVNGVLRGKFEEFSISGKTVDDIASEAVQLQTQEEAFNKLTNNGESQGIFYRDGELYINASYIVGTPTSILQSVYPVGAIYISTIETNPATLFGFGTWEQIKDRFVLASGDTYAAGSTGGEAAHTLTVGEMPAHTHTANSVRTTTSTSGPVAMRNINLSNSEDGVATPEVSSAGGGQAHNNMPPYLAVYMWKRTA